MNYLIHACASRLWYVYKYLVPSMIAQGIDKNDIFVHLDSSKKGNLFSFMDSLKILDEAVGTWHLQDDVLIARVFAEDTKRYFNSKSIVCGFCSKYDKNMGKGTVRPDAMWYSFPCIYIPNKYAKEFYQWWENKPNLPAWVNSYISQKKGDDTLFRYYAEEINTDITAINHYPNLVEHIDYLIGGSLVNPTRNDKWIRATYFQDNDLVEELKQSLDDAVFR